MVPLACGNAGHRPHASLSFSPSLPEGGGGGDPEHGTGRGKARGTSPPESEWSAGLKQVRSLRGEAPLRDTVCRMQRRGLRGKLPVSLSRLRLRGEPGTEPGTESVILVNARKAFGGGDGGGRRRWGRACAVCSDFGCGLRYGTRKMSLAEVSGREVSPGAPGPQRFPSVQGGREVQALGGGVEEGDIGPRRVPRGCGDRRPSALC